MSKFVVVMGGVNVGKSRVGFATKYLTKKDGKFGGMSAAFHALSEKEQAALEAKATIELDDDEAKLMDPGGTCLMLLSVWEGDKKAAAAAAKARKEHEEAEAKKAAAAAAKGAAK